MIDKKSLLEFIAKAHRHTYAAPKEVKSKYRCKTPTLPGHTDYYFKDGEWEYHDSYAGSFWAPGGEVIFLKGRPVWRMSYQGQTIEGLTEEFIEQTFEFLKRALRNFSDDLPFRGPTRFREGDFEYTFSMDGDYRYFTGIEFVKYKNMQIFFQHVMGELIK